MEGAVNDKTIPPEVLAALGLEGRSYTFLGESRLCERGCRRNFTPSRPEQWQCDECQAQWDAMAPAGGEEAT
jgi:hypothetical protein